MDTPSPPPPPEKKPIATVAGIPIYDREQLDRVRQMVGNPEALIRNEVKDATPDAGETIKRFAAAKEPADLAAAAADLERAKGGGLDRDQLVKEVRRRWGDAAADEAKRGPWAKVVRWVKDRLAKGP